MVLGKSDNVCGSDNYRYVVGSDNMARYRVSGPEEFKAVAEAGGTLWERPVINKILRGRLPDHSMDNLPLSDCDIGTIEWDLSDEA